MSTDKSQDAPGIRPSKQDVPSARSEFLWQVLKETANGLMKTIAFYFAISAAILGYVLAHPLAPPLRNTALWVIISITLLFLIAFVSVSWGFWKGMRDLHVAQERLSPGAFDQIELQRFFARTRVVFLITIISLILSLLILMIAIGSSLRNSATVSEVSTKKTLVGSEPQQRLERHDQDGNADG